MELTYKNKKLSSDDMEKIGKLKYDMIKGQNFCCSECGKPLNSDNLPQMAHRISKAKRHIKKYGYEVIHHRFNLRITCADCNSSVSITPETEQGKQLIKRIELDIINKS